MVINLQAPASVQRQPTPQQAAIYAAVTNPHGGNLIVDAKAGSGKTTVLVEAAGRLSPADRVIFLAFNKVIADELRARLPAYVTASTFHSACLRSVKAAFPRNSGQKAFVDTFKPHKLIDSLVGEGSLPFEVAAGVTVRDLKPAVLRLVGLARQVGIGCLLEDTAAEWHAIAAKWEVEAAKGIPAHAGLPACYAAVDEDDRPGWWIGDTTGKARATDCAIEIARRVLRLGVEQAERSIDFDDMLYLPIRLDLPLPTYDWVFVDEAQDTNAIQRAILHRLVGQTGRLVAVGDYRQAIYSFRGADSDALPTIEREFGCTKLPLSVSWRCPQAVIREAQAIVPDIESAPSAIEGAVVDWGTYTPQTFDQFRPDDLIICRNVAPVVRLAFALIKRGVSCRIRGRDIGASVVSLIDKMRARNLDDLFQRLDAWFAKEAVRLADQNNEPAIEVLQDRIEVVRIAADRLGETATIEGIKAEITSLFDDSNRVILTLSTIHQAKGLEAERVWFLDKFLIPSKYAKRPDQLEQEANLEYVGITRAKHSLFYLDSPKRGQSSEPH